MKKLISIFLFILFLNSCAEEKKSSLTEGMWLAELTAMDDAILPFNFKLIKTTDGAYQIEIYNAEEVILVDEIEIKNDSILIKFPVFEGYIAGKFTDTSIEGQFIKESLERIVPFKAIHGVNAYRTETGDYRYLEGVVSGESLNVSAFDGAHAFVFKAKVTDSSMNGAFYSGNHSKELFVAKRNENFELISSDSLTFIKEGYDKLAFSFPNSEGEMISLDDERFKNKVVVAQIMGTWCPNCLDETKYYVDYAKKNPNIDLEFVAIAFEYAKTKEGAFKSIKRMQDRIGVQYPMILAQFGSSDKALAQEKLPMLNHVLSYPTSIFIDKKGNVRKIHTGFNGPATGEKFVEFKKEFEGFIEELLAE